jgi:hypothetical protein
MFFDTVCRGKLFNTIAQRFVLRFGHGQFADHWDINFVQYELVVICLALNEVVDTPDKLNHIAVTSLKNLLDYVIL